MAITPLIQKHLEKGGELIQEQLLITLHSGTMAPGWGWGAGPRRGVLREEGVQVWAEQKAEHPSLATSCPLAQLSPYWTWQGGVRCGKARGIGQSGPFSAQQGQRGEGLHGQGAWGE